MMAAVFLRFFKWPQLSGLQSLTPHSGKKESKLHPGAVRLSFRRQQTARSAETASQPKRRATRSFVFYNTLILAKPWGTFC